MLKDTRNVETAFDILFALNIIFTFVTISEAAVDGAETDLRKANDMRPLFKAIAKSYVK